MAFLVFVFVIAVVLWMFLVKVNTHEKLYNAFSYFTNKFEKDEDEKENEKNV